MPMLSPYAFDIDAFIDFIRHIVFDITLFAFHAMLPCFSLLSAFLRHVATPHIDYFRYVAADAFAAAGFCCFLDCCRRAIFAACFLMPPCFYADNDAIIISMIICCLFRFRHFTCFCFFFRYAIIFRFTLILLITPR